MIKKLLITIYATLFSSFALAGDLFDVPETDKLYQIFGAMFGGLGVFGGSGSDPFINQMSIIDNALLIFSGVITTYLVLSWVIKLAQEGEVGKKTGDVWHLIRYIAACALIIPAPGLNGYTSAQLIVANIVKMGIGVAYQTAQKLFSEDGIKEIATTNLASKKIDAVAHNLFLSSVCRYVLTEAYNTDIFKNTTGGQVPVFGYTTERGMFNDTINIGQTSSYGKFDVDSCGTYTIHRYESSKKVVAGSKFDSDIISSLISQNNAKLAVKLFNDIDKVAKEFVKKKDVALYSKVTAAASEYSDNSSSYAFDLVKSDKKISQMAEAVKIDGALYTGAYYMRITELQSKVNEAIAKVPSASGIKDINTSSVAESYKDVIGSLNKIAVSQNLSMIVGINSIDGNQDSSWWSTIKGAISGDPELILKKIISSSLAPIVYDEKSNLVSSVQVMGAKSLDIGGSLIVAGGAVSLTAGLHPGVATFTQTITEMFAPSFIRFGGAALFITPMIPFYIFVGVMITWICSATATIIIANFIPVCMMFAGNNSMGQGANAFKQLLSIVFKPALSVVCFGASIVLTNLIGQAVMSIFMSAWNLAQDDSGIILYLVSLIFLIASFALFSAFLIFQITLISMKLPDQMISFIGGAGVGIAGEAASFGGAGGAFAGALAGSAAGSAMKAADRFKENSGDSGNKSALDRLNNSMPKPVSQANEPSSASSGSSKGVGSPNSLSAARAASNGSGDGLEGEAAGEDIDFEPAQVENMEDHFQDDEDFKDKK